MVFYCFSRPVFVTFMIPEFPNFKKLELADKEEVEKFTSKFPPYSDFNFTSLWAWDTDSERMVSKLNGNLVIRFTDYENCEPFFSFIGSNDLENTAHKLIDFAKKLNISPILRCVPEELVNSLLKSSLLVEEDRDNFDYIFSISELLNLKGVKFKEKRHSATRFLREYPNASFKIKELSNKNIREQIISVFHRWEDKKQSDKKTYDFAYEEKAINRLLQIPDNHNLIISCVLLDDVMIGFSVDEILSSGYAISHFIKADISFSGIYDFLNKEVSKHLAGQNITLWNWEQDLGIENIRKSKTSYHPINFLKKYKISLINEN